MRRVSSLLRTLLLLMAGCREPPQRMQISAWSYAVEAKSSPPVVIECDERGEHCRTYMPERHGTEMNPTR
jgi:hypothetical protein